MSLRPAIVINPRLAEEQNVKMALLARLGQE